MPFGSYNVKHDEQLSQMKYWKAIWFESPLKECVIVVDRKLMTGMACILLLPAGEEIKYVLPFWFQHSLLRVRRFKFIVLSGVTVADIRSELMTIWADPLYQRLIQCMCAVCGKSETLVSVRTGTRLCRFYSQNQGVLQVSDLRSPRTKTKWITAGSSPLWKSEYTCNDNATSCCHACLEFPSSTQATTIPSLGNSLICRFIMMKFGCSYGAIINYM